MNKALVALVAVIIIAGMTTTWFLSTYQFVTYTMNFQIEKKYTKWDWDDGGTEYWYKLRGFHDVEANSKQEWDAKSVGQFVTVEWTALEKRIR